MNPIKEKEKILQVMRKCGPVIFEKKYGIHRGTVSNYLSGKRQMKLETAFELKDKIKRKK